MLLDGPGRTTTEGALEDTSGEGLVRPREGEGAAAGAREGAAGAVVETADPETAAATTWQ